MFENRESAGRLLAKRLEHLKDQNPVVLALPRGGVPIGAEVARELQAPLDLIIVRKLGAPFQPELAIGAVVDGQQPEILVDPQFMELAAVPKSYVAAEAKRQFAEIARRQSVYLGGRAALPVAGRTAIVVDDGIATGSTVRAALRAIRRRGPARLVLAIPVAPAETVAALRPEVDELVCLDTPEPFDAIGLHYHHFPQMTDEEVIDLLRRAETSPPMREAH
jgi:putative phosphoribosyl transferase